MGVNILAEKHHIWGEAGDNSSPGEIYNNYDFTSNQPLHYRVGGASWWDCSYTISDLAIAESWTGNFNVETYVLRSKGEATAESIYIFQPEFDSLVVDVSALDSSTHQNPEIMYSLINRSTGEQLLYNRHGLGYIWNNYNYSENYFHIDEHHEIAVDPNYIYELQLYVNQYGGDGDAKTYIRCEITSSPISEPTTMLLFGVGFTSLVLLKRGIWLEE